MIDYPTKRPAWKRRQIEKKWQNIFGIFLTLFLLVVIVNGLFKSFSFSNKFNKATWDGKSPLIATVNTIPASLLIYQPEIRKFVLVVINNDISFATGDTDKPVEKLSTIFESQDGVEISSIVSTIVRIPVSYYLIFKDSPSADLSTFENYFKNFVSIDTPFEIFASKNSDAIIDTNLAQRDLFSLWWQTKFTRINDLELVDLSRFAETIIVSSDQKILGIDNTSLSAVLKKYLENKRLVEASELITVENGAKAHGAGKLAADFVTAMGGQVSKIEASETVSDKTQIITSENGYVASYLAKIFDCGINVVPDLANGEIIIKIGRDFVNKFLEIN